MWGNVRAELAKLGRRPAVWLLLGVALSLGLTFTYLVPYAGAEAGESGAAGGVPNGDRGLAAVLPAELVGNSVAGLPVFLGAIALILGVLAVGGEYGWGTWKTVLTQGPSRLTVYAAKLTALAVATLAGVLAMFAAGALASGVIAAAEGAPADWPPARDVLVGVAAGWLVAAMWAALGALLAIALRGVALPIGLGLVWLLAVQNLLAAIAAPLLDWVADLQTVLPGPNAGSLAAALGAAADTPGVAALVGGGRAALVVAGYLAVFVALGGALLRRRDVV
jgi:ABC-type transport system involved in multi-copper enzyme maturation permease subunit